MSLEKVICPKCDVANSKRLLERFVMWLREIWFTIDSRNCRGDLSIWEYHVYRQYKKYVQPRI